jgi:hypothetical protein
MSAPAATPVLGSTTQSVATSGGGCDTQHTAFGVVRVMRAVHTCVCTHTHGVQGCMQPRLPAAAQQQRHACLPTHRRRWRAAAAPAVALAAAAARVCRPRGATGTRLRCWRSQPAPARA